MNRILHWLTVKLSRSTPTEATEEHDSDNEEHDSDNEERGSDEERGVSEENNPGGPGIYGEATGDTEPDLEIIKEPPRTSDMSESYDPYNSGSFKVLKK